MCGARRAQVHTDTKYGFNSSGMLPQLARSADTTLLTPANVTDNLGAMHQLTQVGRVAPWQLADD